MPPKVVSYQPVVDVPIDGRSSIAKNAPGGLPTLNLFELFYLFSNYAV